MLIENRDRFHLDEDFRHEQGADTNQRARRQERVDTEFGAGLGAALLASAVVNRLTFILFLPAHRRTQRPQNEKITDLT